MKIVLCIIGFSALVYWLTGLQVESCAKRDDAGSLQADLTASAPILIW